MPIIDLTPDETRRFDAAGINLSDLLKNIAASLPPAPPQTPDFQKAAALDYLREKLARAITDPEEIRKAEEEQAAFFERLNQNRLDAGESPLFGE